MDLYDKALKFATTKHNGQTRKDGITPYIAHPIDVSKLIEDFAFDNDNLETMMVSALLHDTIEDTDTTYEEIYEEFGETIANIVLELTSDKIEQKRVGKAKYLKEKMYKMSEEALTVKLADRLSNLKDRKGLSQGEIKECISHNQEIISYLRENRALNDDQIVILFAIEHEIKYCLDNIFI